MIENNIFPNLKINGRIFPLWILKNFKKYKLDPIINKEGEDPCNLKTESGIKELRKYQLFISAYLDYRNNYSILLYHGLGSGKTATIVNVYNILYNYNENINLFILIKASLKNDPWLRDLKEWLNHINQKDMMNNIKFIHYDSYKADNDFIETVRKSDINKKNLYVIDEAHNFINNVYNNLKNKTGKRAINIYNYILKEKKENDNTRIILMSGTPAINNVFELALIFNLIRPNIFPMVESQFNQLYITEDNKLTLNKYNKNMFQRRILGLVSYYSGATSDLFAQKNIIIKKIFMDKYQQDIYDYFNFIEEQLKKKSISTKIYKSYTRQASNFVFPIIENTIVTGENRPRPGKFNITEKESDNLMTSKIITDNLNTNLSKYLETMKLYINSFNSFLKIKHENDIKYNHTIFNDIDIFKNEYKFKFKNFWENHNKKSSLLNTLYACSCKMTSMLFYIMRSKGPVLVYSNYVKMEGLEIFKLYLRIIGYTNFGHEKGNLQYTEYHGDINSEIRINNLNEFNNINNKYGELIKIMLLSPAGSEGISLYNVRQVHILEPYWHEVRIEQVIGRAIRQCSHKDLPMEERNVDVYRYMAINKNIQINKLTTDQEIYELAKNKNDLINLFLQTIKETAIDCELFKNHNMINSTYSCFKFNEKSYIEDNPGPAYKEDIDDDSKINNGTNSLNSIIKKIKVIKIKFVYYINNELSVPDNAWFNLDTCIVYDYELDFPIGKVIITNSIPNKLNQDTYIIDKLINIPLINII